MNSRVPQLIPVEARDNYFVLSEQWIMADLPFPDIDERRRLTAKGYTSEKGTVHLDGRARQAIILRPPQEGDQIFADIIDGSEGEDAPAPVDVGREKLERFIADLRARYEYSEAVLPEQRCRIQSTFVEPLLQLKHRPGHSIHWGDLRTRNYLLITGAPGSGKTTLLRHWILWHATRAERGEANLLPLCVPLRECRSDESIETLIHRAATTADASWLAQNITALAKQGSLALAFDGVDEIPIEDREHILSRIADFTQTFPNCRYLLTTRPEVNVRFKIGLEHASILPFDKGRLRQLIYFRLYEHSNWKTFAAKVEAEPALSWIAQNPLAVSMVIARFIRREIAPSFIAEILTSVVDMFVDSWDSSRGIIRTRRQSISPGEKHKILRALAGSDQAATEQIVASSFNRQMASEAVWTQLSEHTGLLHRASDKKWKFRSTAVEEYFLASSFVSALVSKAERFKDLLCKPINQKTSMLVRFIGSMSSDAGEVIDSLLQNARPDNIELVVHITEILGQNLSVRRSILIGYANLVASTIILKLDDRVISFPSSANAEQGMTSLTITTAGLSDQEIDDLSALITAIHCSRDGVGGEVLRAVLDVSDQPQLVALRTLLSIDGELSMHRSVEMCSWTVREILPTLPLREVGVEPNT